MGYKYFISQKFILIASNANAKEVQVEMGHSSVQVTFDLYGHLFPEDEDRRHQRSEQLASELFGS